MSRLNLTRRERRALYFALCYFQKRFPGVLRRNFIVKDAPVEAVSLAELELVQIGEEEWMAHPPSKCEGSFCCFHNPSDHPLKNARLFSRPDNAYVHDSGVFMLLMERVCEHRVGHPDPDSVAWLNSIEPNAWDVHGCCPGRCCT